MKRTKIAMGASSAILIGLITATAGTAEIIIPEGAAGTALRLDSTFTPSGRITGLGNVHGMDLAASRGLLVSASLDEQSRAGLAVAKPEGMAESDHKAHHAKAGKKAGADEQTISLISLVDINSGKIRRQIEVPGMVHHVTVGGPGDRYVVATHPGLDAVSIIDLETNRVTATIQTGPNPNYAVYDPQTESFLVSNAGNATISQIDPTQGYVLRNFKTPAGAEHLAIDTKGRRLFAAEADAGTVSVMNLDNGKIIDTYQIGGELHGIAYQASSDSLFVSAREQGKVVSIDLSGKRPIKTTSVGPQPYHMAIDNGRLVVSSAENDLLWIVDTTTLDVVKTIPTAATGHQMVVIPDS